MPLIRGNHYFDNHFTQVPNHWIRDSRLSFKARGILFLILSNDPGFTLSIRRIADQSKEGKDAIRSAIKELEFFDYLIKEEPDHNGETVWRTHDPDRAENPTTPVGKPAHPRSDNPHTKNTNKNNNKNISAFFDEFWKEYPRKLDKAKAYKAFRSALARAKFEDILAGTIRYKQDPSRKEEFTKYPATWLNADAWDNQYEPAKDTEARKRMEREREWTREYLAEQAEIAKQSGEIPKCQHDNNPALCKVCLKGIG